MRECTHINSKLIYQCHPDITKNLLENLSIHLNSIHKQFLYFQGFDPGAELVLPRVEEAAVGAEVWEGMWAPLDSLPLVPLQHGGLHIKTYRYSG